MRRFKTKTLYWHLVAKTLLISALVLTATLIALLRLQVSQQSDHDLGRRIELAKAIDNIAMVTATPSHIQQFIASSIAKDDSRMVWVVDSAQRMVIASNRKGAHLSSIDQMTDNELRSIITSSLTSGKYLPEINTHAGRHLSVFPLTSARHTLAGKFVLQHAAAIRPQWHQLGEVGRHQGNTLHRLLGIADSAPLAAIQPPPGKVSGIIVVETNPAPLMLTLARTFSGAGLLLCFGFLLATFSAWYVCKKYVLEPTAALSAVLRDQRTGKLNSRVQRFNVQEFDDLARQWNSLLNYRQSAEQRQRVLSKVLEQAPIGIEVTSPDAEIEYANPAYLQMTGYSLIDVIGKTPKQILGSRNLDIPRMREAEECMKAGKTWEGEVRSRRKDGTEFDNEIKLHPIVSEDGELERVVSVRRDITERKEYEQSLIEARNRAEDAEKASAEFLARMSQEMRTPFNSIIGFADIISKEQLGPIGHPNYIEFADLIKKSGRGLLAIITSIIDLSRMTSGQHSLDESSVNLAVAAENVSKMNVQRAAEADIRIAIRDQLGGFRLRADERIIEQMLYNLVSNAVRFNRRQGRVDIVLLKNHRNQIVIEIIDTGAGLAEHELSNAFKPFIQLHSHADGEQTEGIGLGLTLAENQAAVHEAKLTVSSEKNVGSTFKVTFPEDRTIEPKELEIIKLPPADRNSQVA